MPYIQVLTEKKLKKIKMTKKKTNIRNISTNCHFQLQMQLKIYVFAFFPTKVKLTSFILFICSKKKAMFRSIAAVFQCQLHYNLSKCMLQLHGWCHAFTNVYSIKMKNSFYRRFCHLLSIKVMEMVHMYSWNLLQTKCIFIIYPDQCFVSNI